jgi:hypothetical protein
MPVRIWKGQNTETDKSEEHFDVSHVGHVLFTRERNGYDDSDFYAVVWDDETQAPKEVFYATTRGWTYYNSAIPDATPDVQAAYDAYRERVSRERAEERARIEAAVPRKGTRVRVTSGRKVPHGTAGTVIWYGTDKYAPRYSTLVQDGRVGMRVGVKDDAGTVHWTSATNVEVIEKDNTNDVS